MCGNRNEAHTLADRRKKERKKQIEYIVEKGQGKQ